MKGYVFNIQRFSVHDGPGIRTIVFLKGCPLHCQWCANPESQTPIPTVAYNETKCIGGECILCQRVCESKAIFYRGFSSVKFNFKKCINCLKCVSVCPAKAITAYGDLREANDVIDEVEKEQMFYAYSGGGLTISGGEPLYQHEFTLALLKEARRRHIKTAIETTGFSSWEIFDEIVQYLNYILFDIKTMNSDIHRKYTGVGNERILENFKKLKEKYPSLPTRVRTPVVPGVNDTKEDIFAIRNFIKDYPNVEYELLKYHKYGQQKYEYIGKEYTMPDVSVDDAYFEELKKIAAL